VIGSIVLDQIDAMPFLVIVIEDVFEELDIGFRVEVILFVFIQEVSGIQFNCSKYLLAIALTF
jgi:hypothetical protein